MDNLDLAIFLAICLAMLMSREPKRFVVALCVYCTIGLMAIDALVEGWIFYYAALAIEFSAFALILSLARVLKRREDRLFYRVVSGFFLGSAVITAAAIFDYITAYADYVLLAHVVALAHVSFMMAFSDGSRNFIRGIRDRLSNNWGNHFDT